MSVQRNRTPTDAAVAVADADDMDVVSRNGDSVAVSCAIPLWTISVIDT